jgi:hypothetical protein
MNGQGRQVGRRHQMGLASQNLGVLKGNGGDDVTVK